MPSKYQHLILDGDAREKILSIAVHGNNKAQSIGFFRVATGLYYLSKIMVEDELDFKSIDKKFNRFIFDAIGRGHSITSILQFLGSKKALWVLDSQSFFATFLHYFPDIPFSKIQILLSVNLTVSKKISKIPVNGPMKEWLLRQNATEQTAEDASKSENLGV